MRRRQFITLVGGTAATWPLTAHAQQTEQMRRIGVLMNRAADDTDGQTFVAAFRQGLQQLGWSEDRNVRIDIRWGENDVDRDRRYAGELIELAPDIFLASGTLSVAALQRVTPTLPIVFVNVVDPIGGGLVNSLARPGGHTTGFMNGEYSFSGKWLELLKQIAPNVTRAAVIRDANLVGIGEFSGVQGAAQTLGIELSAIGVRESGEIEHAVAGFARLPKGGLIVTPSATVLDHRDLIIALAAKHKLPAVYGDPAKAIRGGLISYGPDRAEQFRRAAGYVDRILKGEKPADLPVQAPTKYETVINLKTAKALGLAVPQSLLVAADEVIE